MWDDGEKMKIQDSVFWGGEEYRFKIHGNDALRGVIELQSKTL